MGKIDKSKISDIEALLALLVTVEKFDLIDDKNLIPQVRDHFIKIIEEFYNQTESQ